MRMRLLNAENVAQQAEASLAGPPSEPGGIAEALRCELAARTTATRRALCQRVCELLAPVTDLDTDQVREVLEELQQNGDVTSGPRGLVAAAPLRAVSLGRGQYLIRGTVPIRRIRNELPVESVSSAVGRHASVAEDSESDFAEKVRKCGGLVVTPERWSGLDRIVAAGPDWLHELDTRLAHNSVPAGGLPEGIAGKWRAYLPTNESQLEQWSRWKSGAETGQLWQTKHERGWRVFAWTSGTDPGNSHFIQVTQDEACRTMLSLDQSAEAPLLVSFISEDDDHVALSFPGFFPRAEFRFLTTMGDYLGFQSGKATYRVPASAFEDVRTVITTRLGVLFESVG